MIRQPVQHSWDSSSLSKRTAVIKDKIRLVKSLSMERGWVMLTHWGKWMQRSPGSPSPASSKPHTSVTWVVITQCYRLCGLNNRNSFCWKWLSEWETWIYSWSLLPPLPRSSTYHTQIWMLHVWDLGASVVGFQWELTSFSADGCLLAASPHGRERDNSPERLVIRALIPSHGHSRVMTSSKPNRSKGPVSKHCHPRG